MRFYTSPAGGTLLERMRIDSTGYVGIGTVGTPSNNLHISTVSGNAECWVRIDADTGDDAGILLSEEGANQWAIKHEASDGDLYVWDYSDGSKATYVADGGTDWTSTSDERIKKDITNINSVLDGINSLRPITYKKKYGKLDKVHSGLIAQEVLPHFPLVVDGANKTFKEIPASDAVVDEDGTIIKEAKPLDFSGAMGIAYSTFVPYLINTIF